MKIILLIAHCLSLVCSFSNEPSSSLDAVNPFVDFSAPSGGVDLFTGSVNYQHAIYKADSIANFPLYLSLKYSSNIQTNARAKNDIAPTGWVGLGWRLGFGNINCDHRETFTVNDDKCFYVSPEGVQNLITDNHIVDNPYLRLEKKFNSGDKINHWIITDINGTKFIYGDDELGTGADIPSERRDAGSSMATRYVFSWTGFISPGVPSNFVGNGWTGDPDDGELSLYPYQWDLQKIIDVYGNEIKFVYEQETEPIHRGDWKSDSFNNWDGNGIEYEYTKESYLNKILLHNGESVEFETSKIVYGLPNLKYFKDYKHPDEYFDPYIYEPEPDAYMEFLERKLLLNIIVRDAGNDVKKVFQFCYQKLGLDKAGEYQKSLLEKITTYGEDWTNELAGTFFSYYEHDFEADDPGNFNYGALKEIKGPLCGSIKFDYKKVFSNEYDKQFNVLDGIYNFKTMAGGSFSDGAEWVMHVEEWKKSTQEGYDKNFNGVAPNSSVHLRYNGQGPVKILKSEYGSAQNTFPTLYRVGDSENGLEAYLMTHNIAVGGDLVLVYGYAKPRDGLNPLWDATSYRQGMFKQFFHYDPTYNFIVENLPEETRTTKATRQMVIGTGNNIIAVNNQIYMLNGNGEVNVYNVDVDEYGDDQEIESIQLSGNHAIYATQVRDIISPERVFYVFYWNGDKWTQVNKKFESWNPDNPVSDDTQSSMNLGNNYYLRRSRGLTYGAYVYGYNWDGLGWERTLKEEDRYDFIGGRPLIYDLEKDFFTIRYNHKEAFHAYDYDGVQWNRNLGRDMCKNGGSYIWMWSHNNYLGISYPNVIENPWWQPDEVDKGARLRIYEFDRGNWLQSFDGHQGYRNTKYKRIQFANHLWSTNKNPVSVYIRNPDGVNENNGLWIEHKQEHYGWLKTTRKGGYGTNGIYGYGYGNRRIDGGFSYVPYSFAVSKKTISESVSGKTFEVNYDYETGGIENYGVYDQRTKSLKFNKVSVITENNGKTVYKFFNNSKDDNQDKIKYSKFFDGYPYEIEKYNSAARYNKIEKGVSEDPSGYYNLKGERVNPIERIESEYEYYLGDVRKVKEVITKNGLKNWTEYKYNNLNGLPSRIISTHGAKNEYKTEFIEYAAKEEGSTWRNEMFERNMLSFPCQHTAYFQSTTDINSLDSDQNYDSPKIISSEINLYTEDENSFLRHQYTYQLNRNDSSIVAAGKGCTDPSSLNFWDLVKESQKMDSRGNLFEWSNSGVQKAAKFEVEKALPSVEVSNGNLDEIAVLTNYITDDWTPGGTVEIDAEAIPNFKHFGDVTLRVPSGEEGPTKSINVIRQNEAYIFSAWVWPNTSTTQIDLSVLLDGVEADPSTVSFINLVPNQWQLIKRIIPKDNFIGISQITVNVSSPTGDEFYLEDIRFHPISTLIKTTYYEKNWHNISAIVNENSRGTYNEYDEFERVSKVYMDQNSEIRKLKEEYEYSINSCALDPSDPAINVKALPLRKISIFESSNLANIDFKTNNETSEIVLNNTTDKILLKSKPNVDDAVISLNGDLCGCGGDRDDKRALLPGDNYFNYAVTAPAGNTNNYTLKITRLSNCWIYSGNSGFSYGTALDVNMAKSGSDIYSAYIDGGDRNKVYLSKLESGAWTNIGSSVEPEGSVSNGRASQLNFKTDSQDKPIVSFLDENVNIADEEQNEKPKLISMYHNGSDWLPLGGNGEVTGNNVDLSKMAIYNETPYIIYSEIISESNLEEENDKYKVYVKRLSSNGQGWDLVGGAIYSGKILAASIDISNGGTPYVAFITGQKFHEHSDVCDENDENCSEPLPPIGLDEGTLMVFKYDGANWVKVGDNISHNFVSSEGHDIFLKVTGDTPFIAYADKFYYDETGERVLQFDESSDGYSTSNYFNLIVKKFDESVSYQLPYSVSGETSHWIPIANTAQNEYPGILRLNERDVFSFDLNGNIPTIVFSNYQNDGLVSTINFVNDEWVSVGNPGFAYNSKINGNSLFLDAEGGSYYTSIADFNNDNKLSVLEYNSNCPNAMLSNLIMESGGNNIDFTWDFRSFILNYFAKLPGDVHSISLTPTLADNSASFKIYKDDIEQIGDIDLEEGKNKIKIIVTGTPQASVTYNILLEREKELNPIEEVTLKLVGSNSLNNIFGEVVLTPDFDVSVFNYAANVPNSTDLIHFQIDFEGTTVSRALIVNQEEESGSYLVSGNISEGKVIGVGENEIKVELYNTVLNQNVQYTFTITRSNILDGDPFWAENIDLPIKPGLNLVSAEQSLQSVKLHLLQNGINSFEINGVLVTDETYEILLYPGGNYLQIEVTSNGNAVEYTYIINKESFSGPQVITAFSNDGDMINFLPPIRENTVGNILGPIKQEVTSATFELNFEEEYTAYYLGEKIIGDQFIVQTPGLETKVMLQIYIGGIMKEYHIVLSKLPADELPENLVVGNYEIGEYATPKFYSYTTILEAAQEIQAILDGSSKYPHNGYVFYVVTDQSGPYVFPPEMELIPLMKDGVSLPIRLIGIIKGSQQYRDLVDGVSNASIVN